MNWSSDNFYKKPQTICILPWNVGDTNYIQVNPITNPKYEFYTREGNIAHIYASYISLSKSSAKITHILWKGGGAMAQTTKHPTLDKN